MLINNIEESIKDRLKDKLSDEYGRVLLAIDSFPEKFSDYLKKFTHPKGAVLLTYQGSSFSTPQGLGSINQKETIDFALILIIRAVKSNDAHEYIEKIKDSLNGFKMPGCTKMYPKKINFLDESYGKWIYQLDFSLSRANLEKVEEIDECLLKKVTYQGNIGEITIE